jgi:hypothetical protein|nr:MAG TPA: hypothetical protein [Caudoviricetes sp.]
MAEETKISRSLTVKDIGIVLDDKDTISTTARPIPRRDEIKNIQLDSTVVSYDFGINNIKFSYHNATDVSGLISNFIVIDNCDYLTLLTSLKEQSKDEQYSLEFYLLDNNKEIPILPYNQTQVLYEKMFYNLETRFKINKNYQITVHEKTKDGLTLYNTYANYDEYLTGTNSLNNMLKDKSKELVISYVPVDAKRVKPTNNRIAIKLIKRIYAGKNPLKIDNIILNAHGGKLNWKI